MVLGNQVPIEISQMGLAHLKAQTAQTNLLTDLLPCCLQGFQQTVQATQMSRPGAEKHLAVKDLIMNDNEKHREVSAGLACVSSACLLAFCPDQPCLHPCMSLPTHSFGLLWVQMLSNHPRGP